MNTQNLSPEEDFAIFQQESMKGNYSHALFHLACALSSDAACSEWLLAADQLWETLQEEIFDYLSLDGECYYAIVALHAYYLWKSGEKTDAIDELTNVISAVPNAYYFPWIAQWLFSIKDTDALSPLLLSRIISSCMNQIDFYANHNGSEIYEKILEFAKKIPDDFDLPLNKTLVTSMFYRRLNRYEEALAAAKEGFEKNPTATNANFIALCYKEMDCLPEMEEYTQLSISIDPSERSICNDMGDVFLGHKQYKKAAEYYALAMEAGEDSWAEPSYYYSRYKLNEDDSKEMIHKLMNYTQKNEENSRAKDLADQVYDELFPEERLFYEEIPYSQESLINLLRQISEDYVQKLGSSPHTLTVPLQTKDPLPIAVSRLESPSAVNAIRLYLSDYGNNPITFHPICNREPKPSFLEPIEKEGINDPFRLWNYNEKFHFTPNVEPPNNQVQSIVMELATDAYELHEWYQKACKLAKNLSDADRKSLEGIMVFPPRCPDSNYPIDRWLMRIQYAAVFLLAALDETKHLLPSPSLKRILFGQIDWPVLAALTVICFQTELHNECSEEVYSLLCEFRNRIYEDSYCFFFVTFLASILHVHGLSEQDTASFKVSLNSILIEDEYEEGEEEKYSDEIEELKQLLEEQ